MAHILSLILRIFSDSVLKKIKNQKKEKNSEQQPSKTISPVNLNG